MLLFISLIAITTQALLFVVGLLIFLVVLFLLAEDNAIRAQIRERERFFR